MTFSFYLILSFCLINLNAKLFSFSYFLLLPLLISLSAFLLSLVFLLTFASFLYDLLFSSYSYSYSLPPPSPLTPTPSLSPFLLLSLFPFSLMYRTDEIHLKSGFTITHHQFFHQARADSARGT